VREDFSTGKYGAGWNLTEGVDGGVTSILYGGTGGEQLIVQLIGALTIIVVGGGLAYTSFKLQDKWTKGGPDPQGTSRSPASTCPRWGCRPTP
jgi:hypothetical protein